MDSCCFKHECVIKVWPTSELGWNERSSVLCNWERRSKNKRTAKTWGKVTCGQLSTTRKTPRRARHRCCCRKLVRCCSISRIRSLPHRVTAAGGHHCGWGLSRARELRSWSFAPELQNTFPNCDLETLQLLWRLPCGSAILLTHNHRDPNHSQHPPSLHF